MNPTVFNSVAQVLALAAPLHAEALRPDATLAQLGLPPAAVPDFVSAVEDAFRLRLPHRRYGTDEAHMTLRSLCDAVEHAGAVAEPS